MIDFGSRLSRIPTSWENRDNTRPIGVWSKNCIGAWITPLSRALCSFIAANKKPKADTNADNTDENAVAVKNRILDVHEIFGNFRKKNIFEG